MPSLHPAAACTRFVVLLFMAALVGTVVSDVPAIAQTSSKKKSKAKNKKTADKAVEQILALVKEANDLKSKGDYEHAAAKWQHILPLAERKLGRSHTHIAFGLNSLANLYCDMGQYSKAEPLYQRSLKIREAKLGKDHPDVADSLHNLALLYEAVGQHAKAEPLY